MMHLHVVILLKLLSSVISFIYSNNIGISVVSILTTSQYYVSRKLLSVNIQTSICSVVALIYNFWLVIPTPTWSTNVTAFVEQQMILLTIGILMWKYNTARARLVQQMIAYREVKRYHGAD